MSIVLASWVGCLVAFFGCGWTVRSLLVGRGGRITAQSAFACVWCGVAVCIGILQLWHLLWPVDAVASAVLLAVGLVGVAFAAPALRAALRDLSGHRGMVVAALAFAIWAANRGLAEGGYDDLGYEWHAVHWMGAHAIVPGIANLSHRLGFNNAHHLLEAALNVGPLRGRVNHLFLGFFVTLLAAQVLWACTRLLRAREPAPAPLFAALFAAPCLIMLLFGMLGPMLSTLKADGMVDAAALAAAALLVDVTAARRRGARYDDELHDVSFVYFTVVILAAVMVAVKLSALVFAAGLMLLATIIVRDPRFHVHRTAIVAAFGAAAVILATWLVRGGLLSGYPLFPSRVITLPVSWRVYPQIADWDVAYITSWARDTATATHDAAVVASRPWLAKWLARLLVDDRFTTVLPVALLLAAAPFAIRNTLRERSGAALAVTATTLATATAMRKVLACMIAIACAAIAFWLVSAPTTRFAYGFFWIAAAAALALSLPRPALAERAGRAHVVLAVAAALMLAALAGFAMWLPFPPNTRTGFVAFAVAAALLVPAFAVAVSTGNRRWILIGLCLLGASPVLERAGAHLARGRYDDLVAMFFVAPGADRGFHDYTQRIPADPPSFVTQSGLRVYTHIAMPFDAPLLTAEDVFDENNTFIRQRDPNDLARGFEDDRVTGKGTALRSVLSR